MAAIMPVINKLLVQPSHDSGLLVAVGDEVGRLLWVDGDPALQRDHSRRYFLVEGLFRYAFFRDDSWETWVGGGGGVRRRWLGVSGISIQLEPRIHADSRG